MNSDDNQLERRIRKTYMLRDKTRVRVDLKRIMPDRELKRPLFQNKYAVETLEYLIQKNRTDISSHIPWIVDAMEELLRRTSEN